ncbi:MAG TPA: metallophosphoesterase [Acidobacteriota bacterium]|nr:metallophosphoesterase [Acidobacteriota bacterium]
MSFLDDTRHVAEYAATVRRVTRAWNRLPQDKKDLIRGRLQEARDRCQNIVKDKDTRQHVEPVLALAASSIDLSVDDFLKWLKDLVDALEGTPVIDAAGAVWGFMKYQQINVGWLASFLFWLENAVDGDKVSFRTTPATIQIPDETTIGVVGDYGTGTWGDKASPAKQISDWLNQHPQDYFVHLGDIYYSGEPKEDIKNFVRLLPKTNRQVWLTLNGNHDMYSQNNAGAGYFLTLLDKTPQFEQQQNTSYFALENSNWIVVGLDTTYFDSRWNLYMQGNLDDRFQIPFLKEKALAAQSQGKKLLIMTHHNGLEGNGEQKTPLWNQVAEAVSAAPKPVYWYWGHVHAGVVYDDEDGIRPRICGHSAIPWGRTTGKDFIRDYQGGTVKWVENRLADNPSYPGQLNNGFAILTLHGADLIEVFYGQDGTPGWSSAD